MLRNRDHNSGSPSAADSTREERRYYCQNWRADISAILTSDGKMVEWVKYSSYGIPFALPAGDTVSDGDWNATVVNPEPPAAELLPEHAVLLPKILDGMPLPVVEPAGKKTTRV